MVALFDMYINVLNLCSVFAQFDMYIMLSFLETFCLCSVLVLCLEFLVFLGMLKG